MGGGWPGFPSRMLGDRQTRWPGYELPADRPFQFVESEVMKAEDYDDFIYDPSDLCLRHYLPNRFHGTCTDGQSAADEHLPERLFISDAIGILWRSADHGHVQEDRGSDRRLRRRRTGHDAEYAAYESIGYNPGRSMGIFGFAPFDFMGDTLRGTRGIMRDVRQRPDKLLAAMNSCRKIMVDNAIAIRKLSGGRPTGS